jgi:hypothetical protein
MQFQGGYSGIIPMGSASFQILRAARVSVVRRRSLAPPRYARPRLKPRVYRKTAAPGMTFVE